MLHGGICNHDGSDRVNFHVRCSHKLQCASKPNMTFIEGGIRIEYCMALHDFGATNELV